MSRRLRLSLLSSGCSLETPLSLVSTRGGSVPHLTAETLQMVKSSGVLTEKEPLLVPANYVVRNAAVMEKAHKGRYINLMTILLLKSTIVNYRNLVR